MSKKLNRSEILFNQMKDEILSGIYSPSESLKEIELSKKYKVSRNTLKMVLVQLESEGLVVIEPNRGAKVRSYSLNEVLNFLSVRSVLEGYIAEITTEVMSEKEIAKMDDLLIKMETFLKESNFIEYSKANQKFHNIIYESCPNQVAVNLVTELKMQMKKYNTRTILVPGRSNDSFNEHKAILDAIKNRDKKKVKESMEQHILNVKETFEKNFSILF